MSVAELKNELLSLFAKKIDSCNDVESLQSVLKTIAEIKVGNSDAIEVSKHYEKIRANYSETLSKLAQ